jgi:ABC-type branched-subunit amino acid transport system permease subunit
MGVRSRPTLSLGQGAFMMIGAHSSGYLTVNEGWPPLAALLFGAALAAMIALALGRVSSISGASIFRWQASAC